MAWILFAFLNIFYSPIEERAIHELNRGIAFGKILSQNSYVQKIGSERRIYKDIVLDTEIAQKAHFTLSLPEEIPDDGLLCIILLDGLKTGREALNLITNQENYAIIAYEYPSLLKNLGSKSIFSLRRVRYTALGIPSEILTIARWASEQSWSNKHPSSVMGFSFGGIFTPAIYHLASVQNFRLGPGVIGYAGADIYAMFYANFKRRKKITSLLASWLFQPLEPALHLPFMKADFLIINGLRDKQVPWSSAKKLQELTPNPKTIINLDTEHLQPDDDLLLEQLVNISWNWLKKAS